MTIQFETRFQLASVETIDALVESAGQLANHLIQLINTNSQQFEIDCGHHYSTQVYEVVRKFVVRLLAEHCDRSLDFRAFVDAYEFLLDQRLAGSAGCFKLVTSKNEKRKRGVFYTPDALARELTIGALLPLVLSRKQGSDVQMRTAIPSTPNALVSVEKLLGLKIVDPAMGAGTFLLSALEVVTECVLTKIQVDNHQEDWRALNGAIESFSELQGGAGQLKSLPTDKLNQLIMQAVSLQCLYGLDVDDAAVELCKIGIAKRCQLPVTDASQRFRNLRHGNALIGMWGTPKIESQIFSKVKSQSLSEKERRDLVCMSFFSGLADSIENPLACRSDIARLNFFHWDLEFSDVFSGDNPGFDLVLTNPPWEIEKANSREFFSRYDSEYMELSKQAALRKQKQLLLQDKTLAEEWKYYVAYHDGVSEFLQRAAGTLYETNDDDAAMPFSHQGGGDSNSYKLFLELGYYLLKKDGVMAQIVPSGIYSDKGATGLRRLFMEKCRWLFLHGYHNREGLFSIHRSFKFCTLAIVKGGRTERVNCSFLRLAAGELKEDAVSLNIETIKRLSPESLAFTEFSHASDLSLIEKLAERCSPLAALCQGKTEIEGTDDFSISFRREFDMTNDSGLFVDRSAAQKEGYVLDSFGHWLKGRWRSIDEFNSRHPGEFAISADGNAALAIDDIGRVLLPVYEGRMIGQYDWAKKAWLEGKGRRAAWGELSFDEKRILPQYLLKLEDYLAMQPERGAKIAYLAVGAATNSRSCIASMIGDWPCGNAAPVLSTGNGGAGSYEQLAALLACLNSFVFDYLLRMRLSANNLNWFILKECLVPDLSKIAGSRELYSAVCELSMHEALLAEGVGYGNTTMAENGKMPALSHARRMKLRAFVEAVIADAYSIDEADCQLILRGCLLDTTESAAAKTSSIDKGFHRIDVHLPADLRGPSLFLASLKYLRDKGAQWLFDHLDSDDVLFSRDYLERCYPRPVAPFDLDQIPNMMPYMVPGDVCNPAFAKLSTLTDGLDRRLLMSRIRGSGLYAPTPPKVPKAGTLGTRA